MRIPGVGPTPGNRCRRVDRMRPTLQELEFNVAEAAMSAHAMPRLRGHDAAWRSERRQRPTGNELRTGLDAGSHSATRWL